MKKNFPFGILLALLLVACGGTPSGNYTSDDYSAPNEPENPSANSSGTTNGEIFIPAGKGDPPNGILEQVSWFGGGGGLSARECGECMAVVDDDNNLNIVNFAPYQNLRLVFYRQISGLDSCGFGVSEFVSIVQVQVDENGSLFQSLNGSVNGVYVNTVIDADTGQIEIPGMTTLKPACEPAAPFTCSGAPEPRVQVGESAYVCTQKDRLIVRAMPISDSVVTRIETGTHFEIIAGPVCAREMVWWKIDVNGMIGWVSEGGDNVDPYFICPVP